jgi:hypothetical protein
VETVPLLSSTSLIYPTPGTAGCFFLPFFKLSLAVFGRYGDAHHQSYPLDRIVVASRVQLTHPHQPYQRIHSNLLTVSQSSWFEKSLIKKIIAGIKPIIIPVIPVLWNIGRRGGAKPIVTVLEPVIVILRFGGWLHLLWLLKGFLYGHRIHHYSRSTRIGNPQMRQGGTGHGTGWVGVSPGYSWSFTSSPAFLKAWYARLIPALRVVCSRLPIPKKTFTPRSRIRARFSALWA